MGDLTEIDIDDLHPTQLTLGMEEVEQRRKQMAQLSASELRQKMEEKAVPHVVGPNGRIYMVDHHHFCRVMHELGHRKVLLGEREHDWSNLDIEAFWKRMEKRRLCWPVDIDGNQRPAVKIPAHVKDLTDNPWRTLARAVRGKAYREKKRQHFQEFRWGNYFRSFMTTRLLETDIRLAEALAVKLARSSEAQDLPGYIRRR